MRRTLAREDVLILLVGVRRKMANVGWDTLLLPAPHHLIDLVLRDSRPRVPLGGGGEIYSRTSGQAELFGILRPTSRRSSADGRAGGLRQFFSPSPENIVRAGKY